MVLKQCQVLVDLSPDITTWNKSKYGTSLRLSSTHSLTMIRKHWKLYIETTDLSEAEMDSLRAEFRMGHAKEVNMTSLRAAGPLWVELNDMGSKQFNRYWKTGVTFEEGDKATKANEINPTFAYSIMGKGFSLHYGSDPIVSFHLAKTLAPISGTRSNKTTISDLVKGAMDEFKSWCLAFSKRIKGQRAPLVIRILVGDAIAVCRALHYCAIDDSVHPGLYTAPWSSALMKLDGGDYVQGASHRAPLQFDVIDTSNLTDHIGLLNILIPCRPLMQTRSSSVIFTDTLLPLNDESTTGRDGFLELLCGNLSVLSMILDLIPVSYPSNFTTHSNVHEIIALAADTFKQKQFHEHNAWRIGSLSDLMAIPKDAQLDQRVKFDERQLATFLFGVYLKMFPDENVDDLLQPTISPLIQLGKHSILHYSRFTLAYLLRFVKDRVDVNWDDVMNYLHDLISSDRKLYMGTNNLQELFCSLHLLDVYSFLAFRPVFLADVKEGPLKGWKNVPPVVCISFEVPRKKFDILGTEQIGSPYLDCSLVGPNALNCFLQYQCFWGKLKAKYSKDSSQEPKLTLEEDAKGFRGTSPAIFTFYIPSWFVGIDAPHRVAVSVRSNPITVMKLASILGPSMDLFSAELTDRRYVHITRERPGNPGELQKLRKVSFARPTSQEIRRFHIPIKVTLDSAARQVALLTGRANIKDAKAKASLANGAAVSISQISPRVMQISIGGSHLQTIIYPFPINSSDSKARIARKSSYVEVGTCVDILPIDSNSLQVDVKISGPLEKLGMSLTPFPVIRQDKILSLWNIHYVNLELLPALDLSVSSKLSFIQIHVAMSFCDRERHLCVAEAKGRLQTSDLDVVTRVKQSIHHLVINSCGLKERRCPVVGLSDPNVGGIFTMIFINAMRLDLASHTVVVDACVLPLTEDLVLRLGISIKMVQLEGLMTTFIKPDEVKAWKHLLPAFTERCRRWSHTANCEYLSRGVPVSEDDHSPLCSCGRGKNLGSFTQKKSWKEFTPYVTRAAISPLFAVPFVDSIGANMLDAAPEGNDGCANCHGPGEPKLLVCARCKNVRYCSVSCQKADWKVHKKSCKEVAR